MAKNRFISFEGIEAAGKTTQIKRLAERLDGGDEIVLTREPPDGAMRDLLQREGMDYRPLTQVFLLSAARYQHMMDVIAPALDAGAIVLCDRFSDSTLAYQGYGLGVPLDVIRRINEKATAGRQPDISFVFDLDVDVMFQRLKSRGAALTSYERLGRDFYEKVRAGFLDIAAASPDRFHVLDASLSEDDIAKIIWRYA